MIFQVQDGCFGYGGRPILRDINFSIPQGDVLAVLGPNGVGKTTLLRCMMGLLKWNGGCSSIDGHPLDEYKATDIWKRIGYVPQAKANISSCTVREMVLLGRSSHLGLFSQPSDEDWRLADESLEAVKMGSFAHQRCDRISGGELQMALIARALCTQPEMLILDEPESNLDFKNQLLILDTIRGLADQKGISAVINTHYPAHALKISDQALLLNRDLTNCCGKTSEIVSECNMCRAFDVNVRIHECWYDGCRYQSVIPVSVARTG
ncbi:MAG: ABC transporter ATP-binding protein [Sphaerochaetaceae bacterium]|nr:ABC transporter ATP-binding protein [Sphaerochaetaceae bacterium]